MKKFKSFFLIAVFAIAMSSCYSLEHVVGDGARGNTSKEKKQWYALWGMMPLNEVDSQNMSNGATDYTIKTSVTLGDFIVTAFTGVISVTRQTVKVIK